MIEWLEGSSCRHVVLFFSLLPVESEVRTWSGGCSACSVNSGLLERVKKLEQSGVIHSYHAHVDPQSIGLNVQTFVLVSLAWQKKNARQNFLDKVSEIDEIVSCFIITGEADFLVRIVCKDIPSYEQLLFKTLSQIEEIERLKTLMTLSTFKDSMVLPFKYE